ncbi:YsnF/AvaK domain-containing protein [Nodosilinea sp. PGN35]|uniref:YsnF/AvaK domain-containing protein n=1 Tax=Nodosilinea sp. PGN35 TaxID=3020489 RepID=UPI0023B239AE|nr:YsnF/AvaK domain-containing protein [Nodosilinea sp. TSF1-S3]MDF0366972.1 YsnF/AvaK domain-containing protein [Nodosilinea sp. TSF1-S3]
MSQQHLINSAVFDRSGHLIGNVVSIQAAADDFALIVQLSASDGGNNQVTIHQTAIRDIDGENRTIRVDLDRQQCAPQASQGIQLVEERLVVNRQRVKVGEVSVRRVVETEMVQIPVRREKLVVEKIGDGASPAEPIEIPLAETQIEGTGIDPDFGAVLEPGDRGQSASASGSFESIRDAIDFLNAVVQQPNHACEKVRVAILLDGDNGLKGTLYEFEDPQTAVQKISRLDKILLNQCNQVRLELFLSDPARRRTYEDWLARYAASPQDSTNELSP